MQIQIEETLTTNLSPVFLDKPVKLNIGCGDNKIKNFLNIDGFEGCKPDLVHDITKQALPFSDNSVDEIVFFHCIEHIAEYLHDTVLSEMWRVLKPGGNLIISYPEFLKCAEAYKNNYRGQRDFFKATIYGRQSHPGDFHVSLMDTNFFKTRLIRLGFNIVNIQPEERELYNTIVYVTKGSPWISREDLVKDEIFGISPI